MSANQIMVRGKWRPANYLDPVKTALLEEVRQGPPEVDTRIIDRLVARGFDRWEAVDAFWELYYAKALAYDRDRTALMLFGWGLAR